MIKIKKEIIDGISENILDQNDDASLAGLISAFDLSSEEGLETRIEKISAMPEWIHCSPQLHVALG